MACSSSSKLAIVDPSFRIAYVLESSLEIEREILPNTTVAIGSMRTHGVHLLASNASDKNLVPPAGSTTYVVCPGPGTCSGPTFTGPNLDGNLLTEGFISSAVSRSTR